MSTLVRLYSPGWHCLGHYFVDWHDGTFTVPADHPIAEQLSDLNSTPRHYRLIVASTKELEWQVDQWVVQDTGLGLATTITCLPRLKLLRMSTISDDVLIEYWLRAEADWRAKASRHPLLIP